MKRLDLAACNPFVRIAMIQPAVMEGQEPRIAYDNRIFFVLEGAGHIILRGRSCPLAADTLVYLAVGEEYYFSGRMRAVVLNFDFTRACADRRTAICPVSRAQYREDLIFDTSVPHRFAHPIIMTADERLKSELMTLADTFVAGGEHQDTLTSAKMKAILAYIDLQPVLTKDTAAQLAEKLLHYIGNNAVSIRSNAALGEVFSYHPAYLAAVFRRKTGKSIHSAILEEKLRIAARLLTYTNYSVSKIAEETGFSAHNHFCTAFKAHYGMRPLAYREGRRPYANSNEKM